MLNYNVWEDKKDVELLKITKVLYDSKEKLSLRAILIGMGEAVDEDYTKATINITKKRLLILEGHFYVEHIEERYYKMTEKGREMFEFYVLDVEGDNKQPEPKPEPVTSQPQPIQTFTITPDMVEQCLSDNRVIKFIKGKFKKLSNQGAVNLIDMILNNDIDISVQKIVERYSKFFQYNMSKFDNDKKLKLDVIKELSDSLRSYISEIYEGPIDWQATEQLADDGSFIIHPHTTLLDIEKFICDDMYGQVNFSFNNSELEKDFVKPTNSLQLVDIQIKSMPIVIDFFVQYMYHCTACGKRTTMKSYKVDSTNKRIKCEHFYHYDTPKGERKTRICNTSLSPKYSGSIVKHAFYYEVAYKDAQGTDRPATAISFKKLEPGYYESVLFKMTKSNMMETFLIIDVKKIDTNNFSFPTNDKGENYISCLIKAFDDYIFKQTGVKIYGLYPIKAAMIIQKLLSSSGLRLIGNIQITGSASTGKSTILKYYSFLLNHQFNLSSNGISISIPGLRGTRKQINVMDKKIEIVSTGYLGMFNSVHIDEAGESPELVQNLKVFLLEDNYSYDKAGSDGITYKRTAHVNLSENLNIEHVGQYRGMIRKAYHELNVKIEGYDNKPDWEEEWDLHKPLFYYHNPYLRKVIKFVRQQFQNKGQFWIDGYDYALHQRFPFYFYLVNEKDNVELSKVIKDNVSNVGITENLEIMRRLKSDDIDNFFNGLKMFVNGENEPKHFENVDKLLDDYGIPNDARTRSFYYTLLKASRILNKRKENNEEDYDLVRWFVENTNRKLDVSDTDKFSINGPPNIKKIQEEDIKLELQTSEVENAFGLKEGF